MMDNNQLTPFFAILIVGILIVSTSLTLSGKFSTPAFTTPVSLGPQSPTFFTDPFTNDRYIQSKTDVQVSGGFAFPIGPGGTGSFQSVLIPTYTPISYLLPTWQETSAGVSLEVSPDGSQWLPAQNGQPVQNYPTDKDFQYRVAFSSQTKLDWIKFQWYFAAQCGNEICESGESTSCPQDCTHLACVSEACVQVSGSGPDLCTSNVDCSTGEPPVNQGTITGSSLSSSSVSTSTTVPAYTNHLYLAAITTRNHVTISSVTGLGLTWTRVRDQCSGRVATGMEVWKAIGTPTSTIVTATFPAAVDAAVIAVTRYSGVDPAQPTGTVVGDNTIGDNDITCPGTGTDASSYSVPITVGSNSLVYAAVSLRNTAHTPGSGFTEIFEFKAGSGGSVAGIAGEDKVATAASTVTIAGTTSLVVDYAAVGIEVRPSGGGGSVCGDGKKEDNEQCDDGNTNNNDGCHSDCTLEFCGNNRREGTEECDGIDNSACTSGVCLTDCTCQGGGGDVCGDLICGPTESCLTCSQDCGTCPQCSDTIDNDDDQATDYPQDFSCSSIADTDETDPKAQCQDEMDNDEDGKTDLADPDCVNSQDDSEFGGGSGGPRGYLTTPQELTVIKAKADAGKEPYKSAVADVLAEAGKTWSYVLDPIESCSGADDPAWIDNSGGVPIVWAKALTYHLDNTKCPTPASQGGCAKEVKVILETIMTQVLQINKNEQQCRLNFGWGTPEHVAAADLIEDYWKDMTCTGPLSTSYTDTTIGTGNCKDLWQNWLAKNPFYIVSLASSNTVTNWGAAADNAVKYMADYWWDRPAQKLEYRNPPGINGGTSYFFTPGEAYRHVIDTAKKKKDMEWVEHHSGTACDFMSGSQQNCQSPSTCKGYPTKSGIDENGIITEDARRQEYCNINRYIAGQYENYPQVASGNYIQNCELDFRRGSNSCFNNVNNIDKPNYQFIDSHGDTHTTHLYPGRGSVEKAIRAVINVAQTGWNHDSALQVAYRYYYKYGQFSTVSERAEWKSDIPSSGAGECGQSVCFGILTHGFASDETPADPPTVPPPT